MRDLHSEVLSRKLHDGPDAAHGCSPVGLALVLLLTGVSCSRQASPQKPEPTPTELTALPSVPIQGQRIKVATLQTASETRHYFLEVQRQSNDTLELTFLVATDSGFEPATALEGSVLTLLVGRKGRESWSRNQLELTRVTAAPAEQVVFRGQLPETVGRFELTAVIPRVRIGGQKLHLRFTLPVAPDAEE